MEDSLFFKIGQNPQFLWIMSGFFLGGGYILHHLDPHVIIFKVDNDGLGRFIQGMHFSELKKYVHLIHNKD